MKGTYIWEFDIRTAWNYDEKGYEGDRESYTVTAPTFDLAWIKVKKIALSPARKWVENKEDEDGILTGKKVTHIPLKVTLEKVERGKLIDG